MAKTEILKFRVTPEEKEILEEKAYAGVGGHGMGGDGAVGKGDVDHLIVGLIVVAFPDTAGMGMAGIFEGGFTVFGGIGFGAVSALGPDVAPPSDRVVQMKPADGKVTGVFQGAVDQAVIARFGRGVFPVEKELTAHAVHSNRGNAAFEPGEQVDIVTAFCQQTGSAADTFL